MPKGIPKNTIPPCAQKERKQAGRPPHKIDWAKVDNHLISGASGVQIAAVLGVHAETIYDACQREKGMPFSQYSLEKHEKGNAMLLGVQFDMAMKRDKTMTVWLGKQRLKQRDKFDSKVEIKEIRPQKRVLALPDNGRRTAEQND